MSAISIRNLSKSFGDFTAVSRLDLEIRENSVFGFLGPNGAGKTTTIRMMVGLTKPSGGSIEIAGSKVEFGAAKTHQSFGYLPEQPSFYGWMSGEEYLRFTAGLFGLSGKEEAQRTKRLLALVDLEAARKKKISTYSNGMKQRLGIAQALMNDPQVLILDEAVSALDPIGRKEVLNILEELRKEKTIFMSTHILADVDRICDDVAIIDRGKLVIQSPLAVLKEKYASPILKVDFTRDPGAAVPELERSSWVKKVEKSGNQIRIWLQDSEVMESNIPLKTLAGFDIGILSYGLTLPETEDLFVELLEKKR
ncbi:MAG: ABC transporter ATP-binding protein [Actinomycetota bacterium]|nr:ABC transporter ATP-binding protein [Actinomycetota bacterium]